MPPGSTGGPAWAQALAQAMNDLNASMSAFNNAQAAAAANLAQTQAAAAALSSVLGGAVTQQQKAAAAAQLLAASGGKVAGMSQQQNAALQQLAGTLRNATGGYSRLSTAQLAVAAAYGYASSQILGFVRAGLSGTTTGEHLAYQFNQLQRQITSLFLPAIEAGISRLSQLVQWFRGLSGEQQRAIAQWAGLSVGMLAALTLVPRLLSAFGSLGSMLSGAALANPILAVVSAVGLLMARSEGGRDTLKGLGDAMMGAFGAIADLLTGVLVPILEYFTELLSKPAGQFLAFAAITALAATRVVSACRAMAAGFMSVGGAITLGLGLIGLLVVALSSSGSAFSKSMDDIAKGVRSGRTSVEDAMAEVRKQAIEQAFQEAEGMRKGLLGGFNLTGPGQEENRRAELEAQGAEKVNRAAAGRRDQRSDVVTARTGTENSPLAVIRRLEDAAMKADIQPKRTADAAEGILAWLREHLLPGKDNRDVPPRQDA